MHVVIACSAFDVPLSQTDARTLRRALSSALPVLQLGVRVLGLAVQGAAFSAALWLLLAGPGFLSARDSVVRVDAARMVAQASR